jgi:predicted aspartyl protease
MSLFSVAVTLRNPARPEMETRLTLKVNPESLYTWVSADTLARIGILPVETRVFTIMTGDTIERPIGHALIGYDGRTGAVNVVFSERGEMEVLGATALEALSVAVDSVRQMLEPVAVPAF